MVEILNTKQNKKRIVFQILAALIIFISGIVAGSGGAMAILNNLGMLQPPRPPRIPATKIAREIGAQYDLTEEQILEVEQIFEKAGQYVESLREGFDDNMELGKQQIIADMKTVMPPEKFEKWQNEFIARLERHDQERKRFGQRPP